MVFPGRGSNTSWTCDLRHSYGNTGSLTYRRARLGIESVSLLLKRPWILLSHSRNSRNFFFLGPHQWHMEVPLNQSYSCQPTPQPQQWGIPGPSVTYTTAHANAGSLTRWVRAWIEPAFSQILVGFVNHWATKWTPNYRNFKVTNFPSVLRSDRFIKI